MDARQILDILLSRDMNDLQVAEDAFAACRLLDQTDHDTALAKSKVLRGEVAKALTKSGNVKMHDLYKRLLLFAAPDDFDAAFMYAEWNRDPAKRFYMPRRKQLYPIAQSFERLAKREIRLLGVMAPPGIGKTTLALGALVWMGLRNPELSILGASHSNSFLRGVYDEILRMLDEGGEYLWRDIFPAVPVSDTNAKDMRIDLGSRKRFETFEFSSIGSGNAGKVRASNLLYADDLVDGIESALSRDRMDKLWQQYHTDLRQRMIGDCVELLIQTPWSVHDPIDRLEVMHGSDPDAQFIHLPALDDEDQSNFAYANGLGFSTEFFHRQRDIMDDASWRALYMTQPVEREGLLYHEEELRRYFDLPDAEPDAIVSVCDTKDRGSDFCVLPIAFQFGNDYYIEDILCDNGNPDMIENRLVEYLMRYKVHLARFESNSAGGKVARSVQDKVKERGGKTRITTKYTTANKETRIIMASGFVKEHFLFKDTSVLKNNKEYRNALRFLTGYTMAGKNKFDDVPDAFSMLVEFIDSITYGKIEVLKRPF